MVDVPKVRSLSELQRGIHEGKIGDDQLQAMFNSYKMAAGLPCNGPQVVENCADHFVKYAETGKSVNELRNRLCLGRHACPDEFVRWIRCVNTSRCAGVPCPPKPSQQPLQLKNPYEDKSRQAAGSQKYEKGQAVCANWEGRGKLYAGSVAQVHSDGSFDIDYDDGDKEKAVPHSLIMPANSVKVARKICERQKESVERCGRKCSQAMLRAALDNMFRTKQG